MEAKAKLTKLSVCDCGFPTLDESISLGTEYTLDLAREESFYLKCGGCGKLIKLKAVFVLSRNGSRPGFLPRSIFTVIPE